MCLQGPAALLERRESAWFGGLPLSPFASLCGWKGAHGTPWMHEWGEPEGRHCGASTIHPLAFRTAYITPQPMPNERRALLGAVWSCPGHLFRCCSFTCSPFLTEIYGRFLLEVSCFGLGCCYVIWKSASMNCIITGKKYIFFGSKFLIQIILK